MMSARTPTPAPMYLITARWIKNTLNTEQSKMMRTKWYSQGMEDPKSALCSAATGLGAGVIADEGVLIVWFTGVAVGALVLGASELGENMGDREVGPAEAAEGVPLGTSLEGEVVVGVCVRRLVPPGSVGTVVTEEADGAPEVGLFVLAVVLSAKVGVIVEGEIVVGLCIVGA
jgi:hypothetical protein